MSEEGFDDLSTNLESDESMANVDGPEDAQRSEAAEGSDGVADAAVGEQADTEFDPTDEQHSDNEADDSAESDPGLDDPAQLVSAVEAILFVVDAPLSVTALASALRRPTPKIEEAIATLRQSYDDRDAGVELRDSAGGVRIYTRPAHARHVERFLQDGQRSRLSQAALETLAVIAYRQPVTRSRVSAIRGVNVDGVVRTLLTRGLIVEVGTEPESGAGLFRTSELFLERMGMQSLEELPSLAPLLPDLDGLETEEL